MIQQQQSQKLTEDENFQEWTFLKRDLRKLLLGKTQGLRWHKKLKELRQKLKLNGGRKSISFMRTDYVLKECTLHTLFHLTHSVSYREGVMILTEWKQGWDLAACFWFYIYLRGKGKICTHKFWFQNLHSIKLSFTPGWMAVLSQLAFRWRSALSNWKWTSFIQEILRGSATFPGSHN